MVVVAQLFVRLPGLKFTIWVQNNKQKNKTNLPNYKNGTANKNMPSWTALENGGLNPGDFLILALASRPIKGCSTIAELGGGWSHSSPIILPLLHLCNAQNKRVYQAPHRNGSRGLSNTRTSRQKHWGAQDGSGPETSLDPGILISEGIHPCHQRTGRITGGTYLVVRCVLGCLVLTYVVN